MYCYSGRIYVKVSHIYIGLFKKALSPDVPGKCDRNYPYVADEDLAQRGLATSLHLDWTGAPSNNTV
jgi:hypothetical protein